MTEIYSKQLFFSNSPFRLALCQVRFVAPPFSIMVANYKIFKQCVYMFFYFFQFNEQYFKYMPVKNILVTCRTHIMTLFFK